MRHIIHFVIGDKGKQILTGIKNYTLKNGSVAERDLFSAMMYCKEEDREVFYTETKSERDRNYFYPDIGDDYEIKLEESLTIDEENRDESIRNFFAHFYNANVNINNPNVTQLNICFYVTIYDRECWEQVKNIISIIEQNNIQCEIDILLLPGNLAFLFGDNSNFEERLSDEQTKQTIEDITKKKTEYRSLKHLILLENYNSNGISLNLNADSIARILGEYALNTISHYDDIFNANIPQLEHSIYSIGVSVLSFDKDLFEQYLLHKAYIHVLDREGIKQEQVDVNSVSQIVCCILNKKLDLFDNFWNVNVKPKIAQNINANVISPTIPPLWNNMKSDIEQDCQSFISKSNLSLPEKEAVFAQLLGEDNALLSGNMFNREQPIIGDYSIDILEFFANHNNKLFELHTPINDNDNDEEKKRKQTQNNISRQAISFANDIKEVNPIEVLKDIKRRKIDLRETTADIRRKEAELESIGNLQAVQRQSKKRLTKEGFIFDGNTYQLLPDTVNERLLEETYDPTEEMLPLKADLRQVFCSISIKDQGRLGACAIFTIVGICEYILKKNNYNDCDLSEAFVYYNTHEENNELGLDKGSTFYEVIKTMEEKGVCLEHFCKYNDTPDMDEPSEEAYQDALQRKIVKALKVKKEDIRSAIAEGYPVAVALKIYDSFEPVNGFIFRPTEEEIQNEKYGRHAMIVCGYSDNEQIYIVRNSWGERFGVKGYCYIPYSYFEDFFVNACIITNISNISTGQGSPISNAVLDFNQNSLDIRACILRIGIDDQNRKIKQSKEELKKQETIYQTVFQGLCNNANRNSLLQSSKTRLHFEINRLIQKKADLSSNRGNELDKLKTKIRKYRILFGLFIILFIVIVVIGSRTTTLFNISKLLYFSATTLVMLTGGVVCMYKIWKKKKKYKELDEYYKQEISETEKKNQDLSQELHEIDLKFYVAGVMIDSLYNLYDNLHSQYEGMKSFVKNLKEWRAEEQRATNEIIQSREPFLTLISTSCLDEYFENNKDTITQKIHLYEMFQDKYNIQDSDIIAFKYGLKQTIVDTLSSQISNYSIWEHITGSQLYSYTDQDSGAIDALLREMNNKSVPFVQINDSNNYATWKILLIDGDDTNNGNENTIRRNFQIPPTIVYNENPYKMTLLQVVNLKPEQIKILQ